MPILFIEPPPGIRPEAKRKMLEKITVAVDEAYHNRRHADLPQRTPEAMGGRIQAEKPKILEALKKIKAGP